MTTVVAPDGGLSMHEDRDWNLWFDGINGLSRMDPAGKLRQVPVSPVLSSGRTGIFGRQPAINAWPTPIWPLCVQEKVLV